MPARDGAPCAEGRKGRRCEARGDDLLDGRLRLWLGRQAPEPDHRGTLVAGGRDAGHHALYPFKTIAERAARDYVNSDGKGLEFTTINPGAVLGPVMSGDFSPRSKSSPS